MDAVFIRSLAKLEACVDGMVEDIKEIKTDNKEIRVELFGKDGFNGIRSRINTHLKADSMRWKICLAAAIFMFGGISILWAAQANPDSESLSKLIRGLEWLTVEKTEK